MYVVPCLVLMLILLLPGAGGCAGRAEPVSGDLIVIVPGVAGSAAGYTGLIRALHEHAESGDQTLSVHRWGAPPPLFFVNFSTRSIHERAELALARHLETWRASNPEARVHLIGHSAGCGVVLGALARSNRSIRVSGVILLAPSVSPNYNLLPALERLDDGQLHVFYSQHDRFFLRWRTGTFGTYDRVRAAAAGHAGFDVETLPPELRTRVVQHSHDPQWRRLGNTGGHFGTLAQRFARHVLTPLLGTSRSSSVNPH